jgi:O-acetyl-ADP-ribose deacetylase (regulator of RNase III)
MPFQIVRDNIVHRKTDAVVNAANARLTAGGGVCGSIFDAAGYEELQKECSAIGHCDVGGAVITKGYKLPAKYIIHAVGPVWQGGNHHEEMLLRSCYLKALNLAKENGLESISFPLISSGIFGYPKDQALQIAISAIGEFLLHNDMTVYLVVYDPDAYQLSAKLFASIQSYIDDHYVSGREGLRHLRRLQDSASPDFGDKNADIFAGASVPMAAPAPAPAPAKASVFAPSSLQNALLHVTETFSQSVLKWIDRKGLKDVDVYKKANLDRKLFSKLRGNIKYVPSKQTAIALAIALELNPDETNELLARAGYALSPCSRFDLIVSYFIRKGNYNIFEINQALFAFDEELLGA